MFRRVNDNAIEVGSSIIGGSSKDDVMGYEADMNGDESAGNCDKAIGEFKLVTCL